ncbi:GNAT family N-acetyltransferase [Natronolimnohabitans sp. A-GB9]|uniref:GNAT family N-acetyltransferase n=1 Tax=Natronolimnohabitans sp. A-GB9 TaxID=3069757 RepID=UPI0027B87C53|nr:GNAT family N-acetyltransferase [Natronolimnohabitans sp. A-GB9]MDQ2051463.1 GNAT family N-acetyltransferase [Natronolimnohabitans sp. A-GB9]
MAFEKEIDGSDEYRVRTYESGDREGILSLFETEWGERPSTDWFDWKYVDDPYLSHAPITLAEHDGEIVAVQGYVPCRVRWRDHVVLALKPVDAVVHPDHRRQGLYSRITEHAIRHYREREPAFFFNYPNVASLGAQQKLGWSEVDVVSMYYRVQRPSDFLPNDRTPDAVEQAADAVARTALDLRRRLSSTGTGTTFEIERYTTPPSDTLESIYESGVPEAFHVKRSAQYYRWILDPPSIDDTVYVARRDGQPVAGLVTRSESGGEVNVFDTVPMATAHDAFADLLAAVIADNEDAEVVSVTDQILPSELLSRFGFVSYETPLLSRFCRPTYMAVRPLWRDTDAVPLSRPEVADPENWCLSFLEVKD